MNCDYSMLNFPYFHILYFLGWDSSCLAGCVWHHRKLYHHSFTLDTSKYTSHNTILSFTGKERSKISFKKHLAFWLSSIWRLLHLLEVESKIVYFSFRLRVFDIWNKFFWKPRAMAARYVPYSTFGIGESWV